MQYIHELFAQKTPYLQWLMTQETKTYRQDGEQIHRLPFSSCMDNLKGINFDEGICLFVKEGGRASDDAEIDFLETFSQNKNAVLVYADEDYRAGLLELYGIDEESFPNEVTAPYRILGTKLYRGAPWFKPDFSPDTLASFFYIGSIFAVKSSAVMAVMREYGGNGGSEISIYELVYRIFIEGIDNPAQILHIPKVLYTNDSLGAAEELISSNRIKKLYSKFNINSNNRDAKVSIVIPSKDNAKVLQKCIQTLIKYTSWCNYEIIIVDNGSSEEQRMWITDMIGAINKDNKGLSIQIKYIYKEMNFNFSKMCNIGAAAAVGDYLLFLNDDIEIMDTDEGAKWLEYMMSYAEKSHIGAVGAKLYFPLSSAKKEAAGAENENVMEYRIQHAGITNMGIGPAHKLGGMTDVGCMYHGHNILNYDMLAVTAACMLISRSVFDEAGGFDEEFAVAYNDVELCFRLHDKGYFNVQVNDAVLIHHESLSRGHDTSPEKAKRLDDEKHKLYMKYPSLRVKDPFYSPNLVQWRKDVEYNTGYLYDYDRLKMPAIPEKKIIQSVYKSNGFRELLQSRSKLVAKIYDRLSGYNNLMISIDNIEHGSSGAGKDIITINGWFVIKNADNADIPRKLWLIYGTNDLDFRRVYEFEITPRLREDVEGLFDSSDEGSTRNTALSGIQVSFEKAALEHGIYSIGVLCRNKLVCDIEKRIEI